MIRVVAVLGGEALAGSLHRRLTSEGLTSEGLTSLIVNDLGTQEAAAQIRGIAAATRIVRTITGSATRPDVLVAPAGLTGTSQ